jgi:hypothetical protein
MRDIKKITVGAFTLSIVMLLILTLFIWPQVYLAILFIAILWVLGDQVLSLVE